MSNIKEIFNNLDIGISPITDKVYIFIGEDGNSEYQKEIPREVIFRLAKKLGYNELTEGEE